MHKVFVEPLNKTVEVEDGNNLRDALTAEGIHINSSCGGCASCSKCIIVVKNGAENLSDIEFTEKQMLGNVFHLTGERMSCQAKVFGNVHVDVTSHMPKQEKKSKKIVRKQRTQVEEERAERKKELDSKPPKEGGFRRPKSFKYSDEK